MTRDISQFIGLLLFLLPLYGFAEGAQEIERHDSFWGDYYTIGDIEPGFWGKVKEHAQVTEALADSSASASDMKKAKLFNIVAWVAVVGSVITSDTGDDGDSFDEENFLYWMPVIVGASYGHTHFRDAAIKNYNAQFSVGVSLIDRAPVFKVGLRF